MKRIVLLICVLLLCESCSSLSKKESIEDSPDGPQIALILDGIGVHGFAGVGVLRELEKERIPLHLIVGNNMGSFIAALYAATQNSFSVEWKASQLEKKSFYSQSLFSRSEEASASLSPFQKFISEKIQTNRFEGLKVKLALLTTDLYKGSPVVLTEGSLVQALLASNAIPGLFPPVQRGSQLLVTGSLGHSDLVQTAKQLGADLVIVVRQEFSLLSQRLKNQRDILLQAHKMWMHHQEINLDNADCVITVNLDRIAFDDFSKKNDVIFLARKATEPLIEKIKEKIEEKGRSPGQAGG